MKKLTLIVFGLTLAASLNAQMQQPPHTSLKVGDTAPDFTLPSTGSGPVKLSGLRGKNVVLAFFPAAFSGGCTKEMLGYQANIAKFEGIEAQVYAISTDNVSSLKAFGESVKASFPFLSDFAKREVSAAYGVLMADRGIANRATFVIDKDGKIQHIEEGNGAIDPTGAEAACSRLAHKSM